MQEREDENLNLGRESKMENEEIRYVQMVKQVEFVDELDVFIFLFIRFFILNNLFRKRESINVYICYFRIGQV